jgi:hypothetical protein
LVLPDTPFIPSPVAFPVVDAPSIPSPKPSRALSVVAASPVLPTAAVVAVAEDTSDRVAGEGLLPAEVLKSYLGKMASMREELQSVLREKMQIESLMQEAASQHARVETALRAQLAGACLCSVP